jgi:hypothetical protein
MIVNIRKFKTGETTPLEIEKNVSVEKLKSLIWLELMITPLQQCLVAHGKKLEEDMHIHDYPIAEGNTIHLLEREVETLKIILYCPGHRKLKITVSNRTFVKELRVVIQKFLNDNRAFKMEFKGTELEDAHILGDYSVKYKSKITVSFIG